MFDQGDLKGENCKNQGMCGLIYHFVGFWWVLVRRAKSQNPDIDIFKGGGVGV